MHFSKPPLGTPLDWENPLNKGTVMALAMNEGHGDKVQDLSMNGNHGTLNNFAFPPTVTSGWNPGQTGIGLNFASATEDYVNCGNKANHFSTALTLSALVKFDSIPNDMGIIAKWEPAKVAYILKVESTGDTIKLATWDGAGYAIAKSAAIASKVGEPMHVAGTYDGTDLQVYIDGNKSGASVPSNAIAITDSNISVGCTYLTSEHLNGSIDQPRIQSRAWSAKEVRDYAINPWQVYLDEDD